jgi:hypothetical protein
VRAKQRCWDLLYTFYLLHDRSCELRSIRLVIEKTHGKEAVQLYVDIRETVSTEMGLDSTRVCLDEVAVRLNDIAQIIVAVFKTEAVKKTRLLAQLKDRSDANGVSAGELVSILLLDFMKLRQNVENARPARGTRHEVADFMRATSKTINRLEFKGDAAAEEIRPTRDLAESEFMATKKTEVSRAKSATRTSSAIRIPPEERLDRIERRTLMKRSVTPSMYEAKKVDAYCKNKTDKLSQLDYVVQQKNKAQENLLKAASLIKKSSKDYNELLEFAKGMSSALAELFDSLSAPQTNCFDKFKSLKLDKKIPLKAKDLEPYKVIQEMPPKITHNELAPLLEGFLVDRTPVKAVSKSQTRRKS